MDKAKPSTSTSNRSKPYQLMASDPVCPSDHRLGLRATLNRGWSTLSKKLMFGDKSSKEPFTETEQKIFSDAAKKMEEMDRAEMKRIRKQNARIVLIDSVFKNFGNNRCPFCNTQCVFFGILKPSCFHCIYCKRTLCKTRGEQKLKKGKLVWCCYICLEKIKIWTMTGEWFYKVQLPDKLFKENKTVPEELEYGCLRRHELSNGILTEEDTMNESSSEETESESETEAEEDKFTGKLAVAKVVPGGKPNYHLNYLRDEFILSGLSTSCNSENLFYPHLSKRTKEAKSKILELLFGITILKFSKAVYTRLEILWKGARNISEEETTATIQPNPNEINDDSDVVPPRRSYKLLEILGKRRRMELEAKQSRIKSELEEICKNLDSAESSKQGEESVGSEITKNLESNLEKNQSTPSSSHLVQSTSDSESVYNVCNERSEVYFDSSDLASNSFSSLDSGYLADLDDVIISQICNDDFNEVMENALSVSTEDYNPSEAHHQQEDKHFSFQDTYNNIPQHPPRCVSSYSSENPQRESGSQNNYETGGGIVTVDQNSVDQSFSNEPSNGPISNQRRRRLLPSITIGINSSKYHVYYKGSATSETTSHFSIDRSRPSTSRGCASCSANRQESCFSCRTNSFGNKK